VPGVRAAKAISSRARHWTGVILTVAFFSLLLAALTVARYNLKMGRGDTKGAFKLAVFVFLVITLAAARFGALTLYSTFFFSFLSGGFPLTSDFSNWYAGRTLFAFVVIMSLAIYGFYTSLAGQPLLKGELLED
jgi:hypothetical protein